jgi:hypothetical protein
MRELGSLLAEQHGFQAFVVIQDVNRNTETAQFVSEIAAQTSVGLCPRFRRNVARKS